MAIDCSQTYPRPITSAGTEPRLGKETAVDEMTGKIIVIRIGFWQRIAGAVGEGLAVMPNKPKQIYQFIFRVQLSWLWIRRVRWEQNV